MATIKQIETSQNKSPRKKQFIVRNQRILDLMDQYKKGALSIDDYFF